MVRSLRRFNCSIPRCTLGARVARLPPIATISLRGTPIDSCLPGRWGITDLLCFSLLLVVPVGGDFNGLALLDCPSEDTTFSGGTSFNLPGEGRGLGIGDRISAFCLDSARDFSDGGYVGGY